MARRSPWTPLVTVVAVAAGVVFGTSATASQGGDLRPERGDLSQVVREADLRVQARALHARRLQTEVNRLSKSSTADSGTRELTRDADAVAAKAGFTAVTGDTVTVTLDDSDRDVSTLPPDGNPNWLVIHQQDIQAVVNALWRGGATSMMIMDQRVISTSAVRCVGNTLILQGRVYSPPFTVTAMGDPAKLRRALQDDQDVATIRQYVDLVGLGYSVSEGKGTTFPAFEGAEQMQHARIPDNDPQAPATPSAARSSQ